MVTLVFYRLVYSAIVPSTKSHVIAQHLQPAFKFFQGTFSKFTSDKISLITLSRDHTTLYKKMCPSVRWSVHPSIRLSLQTSTKIAKDSCRQPCFLTLLLCSILETIVHKKFNFSLRFRIQKGFLERTGEIWNKTIFCEPICIS